MELAHQDITYLQGVGLKRATVLKQALKVQTALDLLYVFPYKYIDRSRFWKISEIEDNDTYVQIIGSITDWRTIGEGKHQRLVAVFTDGQDAIELVWFSGIKYLRLQKNVQYLLFGKPTMFNHQFNIVHPELELLSKVNLQTKQGLEPYYNTSERMKSAWLDTKAMRKIISALMPALSQGIPDTLPAELRQRYHLMGLTDSLMNVHFPKDVATMKKARERLKFEELFYIQLQILRQTRLRDTQNRGFLMPRVGESFLTFYNHHLPFPLTNAQKRVIREIHADLKSGKQMNRLLQGDVGSGKTMVALLCALIGKDNKFQTCLMAPTEILAQQHYQTFSTLLAQQTSVGVALLTGSTPRKQRETIHQSLLSGEIDILIGTHALLEDVVQFANLGLVIVDEQHRFGVAQRAKLWAKNMQPPHILVMTATPIPRTLAMTVYGDLSVSVIDELPPGRKPIRTLHYTKLQRRSVELFIYRQVEQGRQVYVVYPLIEESKNSDLADLETGFQQLCETFPQYAISIVHGRMKPQEKEQQMRAFMAGSTQILVATTVIEVGVNVPNATVMIVENAERFGLSQLHQLRGRVGRGAAESYCILVTNVELSRDTRKRMDIMVATNDGFRIAEADLQLRGPGDLEGTQQSGLPFELKIASLSTDGQLLEVARHAAEEVLDEDPLLTMPKNGIYLQQLNRLKPRSVDWSEIS